MARPPGTGQPFASPPGMAELFVRLLWCRAPCWGGPIRAVAVLGPVRGPARASLRPLHPRLGHRLPASTASQLVAIRVCLGLSHRICTPALALRPGEAVLVVFRSGAAASARGKFPFPHQAINRDVAWPRSCALVWAHWGCAATPGPTPHIPPVPIPSPGQSPSQTHTGHRRAPPCLPRGPSTTDGCGTCLICEILPGAVGHPEQDKPTAREAVPAALRTSRQLPSTLSAAPVFDGHG